MTPDDVLHFWLDDPGAPPLANAPLWYKKDDAFDATIRDRFGVAIEQAMRGDLAEWQTTPRGRLAFIILLDQFTRNVFRNQARAFAGDHLAREASLAALNGGDDRVLSPVERQFVLMPLMHAEDRALQAKCVEEFTRLRDEAPESLTSNFASSLKYAIAHRAIIDRFGRFPHRNAIVGRASTEEETEFLKQPGSSF